MAGVFVTGGTGFIGSAVIRALLGRQRNVRVFIEPGANTRLIEGLPVEKCQGDVRDLTAMRDAMRGCTVVYHMAAIYKIWTRDCGPIFDVNIGGTTNVLLAAQMEKVEKVVHTSSISTLGTLPEKESADEETPFTDWQKANPYILSKVLSERIAVRFARAGLPVVIVNPAFPFGPCDIGPTPTGEVIINLIKGRIPGCFKGGFAVIDVDDAAAGHLLAEERGRIGERYLLANHNVSYRELFDTIAEVAGVRVPRWNLPKTMVLGIGFAAEKIADHVSHKPPVTTYGAMQYATRYAYFNNRKAREELGLPTRPFRETIERAVQWFQENGYL